MYKICTFNNVGSGIWYHHESCFMINVTWIPKHESQNSYSRITTRIANPLMSFHQSRLHRKHLRFVVPPTVYDIDFISRSVYIYGSSVGAVYATETFVSGTNRVCALAFCRFSSSSACLQRPLLSPLSHRLSVSSLSSSLNHWPVGGNASNLPVITSPYGV